MAKKDIEPYGNLSHMASLHGGPDNYITDIENGGYIKGYIDGKNKQCLKDVTIAAILFGIYKTGSYIYEQWREKKKILTKSEIAKKQLKIELENISDADEDSREEHNE